uniref:Uncharacterized protein n=1 Tax=Oryza punctata TaxID=4537 RepID=A0A0E0LHD4_ORYPU
METSTCAGGEGRGGSESEPRKAVPQVAVGAPQGCMCQLRRGGGMPRGALWSKAVAVGGGGAEEIGGGEGRRGVGGRVGSGCTAAWRASYYGAAAALALKPKKDVDAAAAPFSQSCSVKRRYDDLT